MGFSPARACGRQLAIFLPRCLRSTPERCRKRFAFRS